MNFGKIVKRDGEYFVKDVESGDRHHVSTLPEGLSVDEYVCYEINENDDATDLRAAVKALVDDLGIRPGTGSFYTEFPDGDQDQDPVEAEAFFGTCELTGMRGNIVPCMYLTTAGEIVRVEAGTWLVHSVLGRLAGAF